MRQAFGISRMQNQPINQMMSGMKIESSVKKNYGSEMRPQKLGKIYEEDEPHDLFGHRYQLEDYEFLNLYETTKQMVAQQLQMTEPHEMAVDLITRYSLVQELTIQEEQQTTQIQLNQEIPHLKLVDDN